MVVWVKPRLQLVCRCTNTLMAMTALCVGGDVLVRSLYTIAWLNARLMGLSDGLNLVNFRAAYAVNSTVIPLDLFISCWMANNEFLRDYWDETTGCDGDEHHVLNFH